MKLTPICRRLKPEKEVQEGSFHRTLPHQEKDHELPLEQGIEIKV
jgi:hypothetical protein